MIMPCGGGFPDLLVRGVYLSNVDTLRWFDCCRVVYNGGGEKGIPGIVVYDDRVYTCLYVSEEG
jgi:hypothetical protein